MYSYSCKQFPLLTELYVDLEYPKRVPPKPPSVPLHVAASWFRSRAQSSGEIQLPTAPLDIPAPAPAPAPPVSNSASSSTITNEALLDGFYLVSGVKSREYLGIKQRFSSALLSYGS